MADTEVCPEIYGKRFLKNDTDDLHIKLSDAMAENDKTELEQ